MSTKMKIGAVVAGAGLAIAGCAHEKEQKAAQAQAEQEQQAAYTAQATTAKPPEAPPTTAAVTPPPTTKAVEAQEALQAAEDEFTRSGNSPATAELTKTAVQKVDEAKACGDSLSADLKERTDLFCAQLNQRAASDKAAAAKAEKEGKITPPPEGAVVLNDFKIGKADLTSEMKGQLDQVAEQSKANDVPILIEGHTDNTGSEELNDKLSLTRAAAGRDYLIEQGINADRIELKGAGEREPQFPNDSAENRAKNRRIVVVVEAPKPVS